MSASTTWRLPETATGWVTDGGLETDLIFHHGLDLPDFAAFPLLEDATGRGVLSDYYRAYADVAARAGAGLLLETPTWRANPDWGARLGYDVEALRRVNREAVDLLRGLAGEVDVETLVVGAIGPRGDGYRAGDLDAERYADYHRPQVAAFAEAGADLATAYTLTTVAEAVGVVRAGQDVGLPVGISFTVETDGRLPDGTPLGDAVQALDRVTGSGAAHLLVNCAHPDHVAPGLEVGSAVDPADRRAPGELLTAEPRRARRRRGARRGRPGRPRGHDPGAGRIAAVGADRGWLLRHRLPPRRRHVGRLVTGRAVARTRHTSPPWGLFSTRRFGLGSRAQGVVGADRARLPVSRKGRTS